MSRLSSPEGLENEASTLSERVVTLAVVNGGTTVNLTRATHANRTIVITGINGGLTLNLPGAVGSGDKYRFVLNSGVASTGVIIAATHGDEGTSNVIRGAVTVQHSSGTLSLVFRSTTNDTITLNGTTTGGAGGDVLELLDYADNTWLITHAQFFSSGAQATPFSG